MRVLAQLGFIKVYAQHRKGYESSSSVGQNSYSLPTRVCSEKSKRVFFHRRRSGAIIRARKAAVKKSAHRLRLGLRMARSSSLEIEDATHRPSRDASLYDACGVDRYSQSSGTKSGLINSPN